MSGCSCLGNWRVEMCHEHATLVTRSSKGSSSVQWSDILLVCWSSGLMLELVGKSTTSASAALRVDWKYFIQDRWNKRTRARAREMYIQSIQSQNCLKKKHQVANNIDIGNRTTKSQYPTGSVEMVLLAAFLLLAFREFLASCTKSEESCCKNNIEIDAIAVLPVRFLCFAP